MQNKQEFPPIILNYSFPDEFGSDLAAVAKDVVGVVYSFFQAVPPDGYLPVECGFGKSPMVFLRQDRVYVRLSENLRNYDRLELNFEQIPPNLQRLARIMGLYPTENLFVAKFAQKPDFEVDGLTFEEGNNSWVWLYQPSPDDTISWFDTVISKYKPKEVSYVIAQQT
jgi:hypothetical protein